MNLVEKQAVRYLRERDEHLRSVVCSFQAI